MDITVDGLSSILHETSSHIYIKPHPQLATYIAHYTLMLSTHILEEPYLSLVPDVAGCIVISYDGTSVECMYWGPTTTMTIVENDVSRIPLRFFIEFQPLGAYAFFRQPQHVLTEKKVPLSQIDKTLEENIQEGFRQSSNIEAFVKFMDTQFCAMLQPLDNQAIYHIQQQIEKKYGVIDLDSIVHEIGYSKRQIQRMFQEQLGTNMKTYARIMRINKAVQLLHTTSLSFSEIAHEVGYYDQAHFIHDFKKTCEITPTQYVEKMSYFYNENYKF